MRTYICLCGDVLFYDNSLCLGCGHEVGFCPGCRNVVTLLRGESGQQLCGNPQRGMTLNKRKVATASVVDPSGFLVLGVFGAGLPTPPNSNINSPQIAK